MDVRDPVHGNLQFSDSESLIIETREFQRLRAIKQLGFAEFSFPAATHNRYLHSLGVSHLAGIAFDKIFHSFPFSKASARNRFRTTLKLAALLHDVGHGPLSHTTEEVMPAMSSLKISAYENRQWHGIQTGLLNPKEAKATHEDYTVKYITDSAISQVLKKVYSDITPQHVACLIEKTLYCPDDFFIEQGIDFRPILSQLISSELDIDRMDYLERDSYFCGTSYGHFDLNWMLSNLAAYMQDSKLFLALSRRALYTFDDFLISRHHMHLMVYFHHKSIIYEEMLTRYLTSPDCNFFLPSDINEYTNFTDYKLYEHLLTHSNPWAQRVALRKPYKVLIELHSTQESIRPENIKRVLEESQVDVIWVSSKTRLSKYHSMSNEAKPYQIFVVDPYDRWDKPVPIDQSTEIFQKYEGNRIIDRLYVSNEDYLKAEKVLLEKRL